MKTRTLIATVIIAFFGTAFVQAQRNVQKVPGNNNITEDLTFGSGRTLTAAAGSTVNFGSATVSLPTDVPRFTPFVDPNTDTLWFWDDSAGAWVLATFPASIVTSGTGLQLVGDQTAPGNNKLYGTNGSGVRGWYDQPTAAGSVTSVGLSLPAIFTVTGSPVTSTGTLTGALASQTANTIFAAPNGSAGTPAFRAMIAADVPNLTLAKITDAGGAAALNVGTTAGTVATGDHTHTGVYQNYDADLDDLADGSLTGTKVGFADTNNDFSASNVQAAIEELVSVNGSGPNAGDGKVSWSQLVGVPAGFADGSDDGGGGGGSGTMTTTQEGGVQVGDSDIVTLNFDSGFDLVESPNTKITVSMDGSEVFTGGDLTWSGNTPSIATNAVALSTDTTGNYVATIAGASNQTSVSGSGSEGAAVTVGLANDIVVPTSITVPNTGLHLFDTDSSHDMIIAAGSNLTADRQLTISTGDAARAVTLSGDLNVAAAATVSGTNTGDQTITLTGDATGSGTGSIAMTVSANAISSAKFRQSSALSVVGNATASTGNVADIAASATGQVLRYAGTTLGFGALDLDDTDAVTGTLGVANGGTNLASGTSGGILAFTGTTTLASSGALTANGVVLGGGAGAVPTSSAAGTANQVLRVPGAGGAPAFGAIDLSQAAAVTGTLGSGNLPATVVLDTEIDTAAELDALGIVNESAAQTITGAKTFSTAPIVSRTDLNGGTSLTVGTHYWDDAIGANRTLTFSGTPAEGDTTSVKLQVTGVCTWTIPSSKRIGEADSAITSLLLYPGNHVLAWTYVDSEWTLADSVGVLNNATATADPTTGDDIGDGYSAFSQWVNTSNGTIWLCRDSSLGSAIWERVDSAGGDTSTNTSTSVDNELVLFSGTGGKTLKRASTSGLLIGTSGVIGAATVSAPLSYSSGTLSIPNAAADGSTRGAASFAAADFDATSGNITLDYANAQKASGSVPGFLTASDWSTFNNKLATSGTAADVNPAGTAIAAALLGKANDNTSGNRNVATLSGTFTTSTDRNAAAGKRYQFLDPDGATRNVALTSPGSTGETVFVFTNTGTGATDVLNFTDPTPDITVIAGYRATATWNGTGWDIVTDSPSGAFVVAAKSGNYTIGTDSAREAYGGIIYVSGAATITAPAVQPGMSFTVVTVGAVAVSVDVNAADRTVLDGTALADGDKATNTSTAGDIIVFTYESSAGWYASSDGWTDGN